MGYLLLRPYKIIALVYFMSGNDAIAVFLCYTFFSIMGEKTEFQVLTSSDRLTVILYRTGIALSSSVLAILGYLLYSSFQAGGGTRVFQHNLLLTVLLFFLYFSVGLSVFFIHLYIGKLYRFIKKVYYLASVCLLALIVLGGGNPVAFLMTKPVGSLLLLPVVFCLGFITAKEAFCFRLYEGYLLFALMPGFIVLLAAGAVTERGFVTGTVAIAVILVFFTFRKVFMPLHYDIGDKSAYTP